ncbi:DUF1885 family protein [Paenibacillus koleovorans]|uniref:DUF1885 family protein n=1 Tax=Paenibacillus koleovorans TaxID=121608 RepID=UPI000FD9791C|nr:DUF1885 family protein [Paenibacillus koleovorans]
MAQSAYMYLSESSVTPTLSVGELKERLLHYKDQLKLTGQQLGWEYAESAFPYTIETKPEGADRWFYLKGTTPSYNHIILGVGTKAAEDKERAYVQVVLPSGSTHGDKAKGNELCKYLAKTLKAELHLFNGRVMYFNPRK